MKEIIKKIPQWLVITGQSGSGKGTVATIIQDWYQKLGLQYMAIGTGDLIRDFIKSETLIAKKMKQINDIGSKQPPAIATSLWISHIFENLKENEYIFHEGSPRSVEEFNAMYSLIETGYLASILVIEVMNSDAICEKRLIDRTKKDGRIDLSIEGEPGVPDIVKIRNKLSWWNENRLSIISSIQERNVYASISNAGQKNDLNKQLAEVLGAPELCNI